MLRKLRLRHPSALVRLETILSLLLCVVLVGGVGAQVNADSVTRFINRNLLITDDSPGVTTDYKVSFNYNTLTSIGSLDMLFCTDPIPYDACDPPTGLDVSHAVLSDQQGNTNFVISQQSSNHIVLSRVPEPVSSDRSSYTLSGIINPTTEAHSYSIRLSDYASSDASGTLIDLGSVVTQVSDAINFETQVPPILTFCLAKEVTVGCQSINGGTFTDMGTLSSSDTLVASSQMSAETNAVFGYAITVNGPPMEAGLSVITPSKAPEFSTPGKNQFGINLVANNEPQIGQDMSNETSLYTHVSSDYSIPNKFEFNDGDVVASADFVSVKSLYTVSYIVNSAANLPAGVYSTTLTFICSGRF